MTGDRQDYTLPFQTSTVCDLIQCLHHFRSTEGMSISLSRNQKTLAVGFISCPLGMYYSLLLQPFYINLDCLKDANIPAFLNTVFYTMDKCLKSLSFCRMPLECFILINRNMNKVCMHLLFTKLVIFIFITELDKMGSTLFCPR